MSTVVTEIRVGRNFIRQGDTVRVTKPGKRSYLATFKEATLDADGNVEIVEVHGAPKGRIPAAHYFTLDQIARVAQTKNGERREVVR